jgi:hypothetical protein
MIAKRDNYNVYRYRWVDEEIEEHDGDYNWSRRDPTRYELATETCRRLRHIRTATWIVAIAVLVEIFFGLINILILAGSRSHGW